MNPAWKSILDALKRIKKITPEEEAKLVAAFSKGGNVRDVVDDFLTGIGDKVRGGVKAAWKKGGPEAVIGAAKATSRTTATASKAARAVKGAVSSLGETAAGARAVGAGAAATAGRMGRVASSVGRGLGTAAEGIGGGLGAAWRMSRPWMGVAGKGALLGLGGLGALYTLLELPGMVGDGLDIAEDAGLDPRGRKEPLRAGLRNRMAASLAGPMDEAGEMGTLEKQHEILGQMEGLDRASQYGKVPEEVSQRMDLVRELPFLAAHQDELMAIQKKAAMQDSFEAAAMRLLGR